MTSRCPVGSRPGWLDIGRGFVRVKIQYDEISRTEFPEVPLRSTELCELRSIIGESGPHQLILNQIRQGHSGQE